MKYHYEDFDEDDFELEAISQANIRTRLKFFSFILSLAMFILVLATGKFDNLYIFVQIANADFQCGADSTFNANDNQETMVKKANLALATNEKRLRKQTSFEKAIVDLRPAVNIIQPDGSKSVRLPEINLISGKVSDGRNAPSDICGFSVKSVFN